MRRFIKDYFKKVSLSFVLLLACLAGAILLFGYLMHGVLYEDEKAIDNQILAFISTHWVTGRLTTFMKSVTFFASATFLQIAFGLLTAAHLLYRKFRTAFEIASIGIGGYALNYIMKLIFHRTRPPNPLIPPLKNFSFPSGHATSGFIFYGLLAYLIWESKIALKYKLAACIALIGFALLIGFSRVYLRVHYPSDVVAGFCVGYGWLFCATWIIMKLKKRRIPDGSLPK